jgi:hypothetical protein
VSSAILYVAIVAIWIGVLVPRWLRHDNTRDGHTGLRRFSRHREAQDPAEWADDAEPETGGPGTPARTDLVAEGPGEDSWAYPGGPELDAPPGEPATEVPPVPPYGWSAEEYARRAARPRRAAGGSERPGRPRDEGPSRPRGEVPSRPTEARPPAPRPGEHQARMVMARRRMLMMLIGLSLTAVAMAFVHLAAWWVVVPPAIMLGGYIMLLREAARADAEQRERLAAEAARARQARQARERAEAARPAPAPEPVPEAEIIDISAQVGDQLYDQYADAKLRAVGD